MNNKYYRKLIKRSIKYENQSYSMEKIKCRKCGIIAFVNDKTYSRLMRWRYKCSNCRRNLKYKKGKNK